MKKLLFIAFITGILALLSTSCKKDTFTTDPGAKLSFSQDSVLFDTVFTTAGSTTKNIRVRNKNNQKIKISNISLKNGTASPFILNVDGSPGKTFTDVEIAANDSIYIFIQVYVNPTNSNSPLIISDAIVFQVNGNTQELYLEAWGQDAYYHKPKNALKFSNGGYLPYSTIADNPVTGASISNTIVTWPKDKPHVIYGWLVVDSTQQLIIQQGTKVHFHQNAGMWVYRYGTLKVNGALNNEVVFQGDRLEPYMQDEPGQWDRIWINEGSVNNEINYAIIKNGFIGIQAELLLGSFSSPRRLRITNTKVYNMKKWGLYAIAFNIYGGNNVFSNCKEYTAAFVAGGNYRFIHSTFANFWNKDPRSTPSVHIDNHAGSQQIPLDTCYFGNCIVDGSQSNELELDIVTTNTFAVNYVFSNSFLRTTANVSNTTHFPAGNRINGTTSFVDPGTYNFELNASSGATNLPSGASLDAILFPLDLKGTSRISTSTPDAGAYELP